MTRAVWWLAASFLAASLGVAADTSTSGTASRQNDLSNDPLPLSRSTALPGCDGWAIDHAAWLRLVDNPAVACASGSDDATDLRSGTGSRVEPTAEGLNATGSAAAAHRSCRQENSSPSKRPMSGFKTAWDGGHSSRPATREIASGVLRSTREGQGAAASSTRTRRDPTLMAVAHLDQGEPDDQTGQMAGENPPVSSTVLPLLGLVGVGSLIAGFFMRR